ncbi:MAG TPA: hypothetical protein VH164_16095 [Ktedonobacteraceae bacterium]|jgi:hypothetical protein|nr:hypothetical protein [Ktedonobacteraceae bacterium]
MIEDYKCGRASVDPHLRPSWRDTHVHSAAQSAITPTFVGVGMTPDHWYTYVVEAS